MTRTWRSRPAREKKQAAELQVLDKERNCLLQRQGYLAAIHQAAAHWHELRTDPGLAKSQ